MAAVEALHPARHPLKPITVERPEPGAHFTASEIRRIQDADAELQSAEKLRDEVTEAIARAKAEASYFRPTEPSEDLADALAFMKRKPLREPVPTSSPEAMNARRALPGLQALLAKHEEQIAVLRGKLRQARADAYSAGRRRRIAGHCHGIEIAAHEAAGADAFDGLLAKTANAGRLDDGVWRFQSVVIAPAAELLPAYTRPEVMHSRPVLWSPLSTAHTAEAQKIAAEIEAEVQRALPPGRWPF